MSILLFFDENVNGKLAKALLHRHVDVLTVQKGGMRTAADPAVFSRSMELQRVLVSNDEDMIAIAADCMDRSIPFPGLIFLYCAPLRQHLDELEYLAKAGEPEEFANSIWYLPL